MKSKFLKVNHRAFPEKGRRQDRKQMPLLSALDCRFAEVSGNGQSVCAVGEANLSASMIGCANGAYALLREGRASDPSRVKDHYTLAIKEKSDTQGRSPVSRQARSATFSLT